jgi:type I restriction enzyme M protein
MRAIEKENPDLADVLPKTYHILDSRTLAELLKVMASIPMDKGGDTFGLIYEYFLGKFAMSEGQKGGEFYTPTAIVRLIVEILEPYHGRIFDPACGSGGMFIQSARFVEEHRKNPTAEISVHGQERVTDTSRLARLNLAVHGLSGEIKQGNTYYEDLQDSVGRFDFVMANPPFNVSKIDKERLAGDPRYPFGIPRTDNGNYLWIQHFHSALNPKGRAGFVMANSAADARASEQEIREKLIRSGDVDVMVSIGPNFFYTVTLPCTLWFFDKGKSKIQNRQSSILNRQSQGHRPLHRRPPHLPPARPRPPRLHSRANRVHRQPRPPLPRPASRIPPRLRSQAQRILLSDSQLLRRPGAV